MTKMNICKECKSELICVGVYGGAKDYRRWLCPKCDGRLLKNGAILNEVKRDLQKKIKYGMSEEKIEQNTDRVYIFMFHSLGCSYEDAKKIFNKVLERRKKND
jgi:hypothetical protein